MSKSNKERLLEKIYIFEIFEESLKISFKVNLKDIKVLA